MSEGTAGRDNLGGRSITAMLWGTGGAAVRIVLQVVSQIALARLLGPELFGIYAVALVVILLAGLFGDVGLAYGLIQKPSVSNEDIRFVVTWQVLLGVLVALILWTGASAIASLYGDPRVAPVIAALAPVCLVNAASATSGALLRREMDFKTLNIAAVVSYAVGYIGVSIPLALAGAGVGALVAGFLIQSSVLAAIQYVRCRHPLRPLLWYPEAKGQLGFGLTVLATNLVNWAMTGVDRAIAGMSLGVSAAGLYATAHNLISTPLLTVLSLLQSIFYSASAKVQDDKTQLGRGLETLFGTVLLFAAPVFFGVAGCAETIFLTLYGTKWSGGGVVLAPLALAMPAQLLMGLATPVLWASGATRREVQIQIPVALVWILVLWLIAQWSSLALLAWAVCALFYVRAGLIVGATLTAIRWPTQALLQTCRPGLAVTAFVGLASLMVDSALSPALGHGPLLLILDVTACALAFLLGLRLIAHRISNDILRLMAELSRRIPGRLGDHCLRLLLGRAAAPPSQA